ncbi:rhodanese-like domain-containing protein [Kitasatospora cineracea]|uniref:Rhodanese-related sulfurtransferase n=1 Tax=Kitasatospora cineracea TaxID=88074 RepID=A0A3N4RM04_9ACTN|nr:rhodanese-like domain-containing protein [Kitasatospora cineracea]RPE29417.1 rhodanese-related sulfurtransferase [Kitasatospora cineracea]
MAWTPQPPAPAQIDPTAAHRLAAAGEALLLDVREPEEHAGVHAPGSLLVPLGALGTFGTLGEGGAGDGEGSAREGGTGGGGLGAVRAAAGGRLVLAVCRSGTRSQTATELLNAHGVPTVNVAGGMRAWLRDGLPAHRNDLPAHRDECHCGGAI